MLWVGVRSLDRQEGEGWKTGGQPWRGGDRGQGEELGVFAHDRGCGDRILGRRDVGGKLKVRVAMGGR